MKFLAIVQPQNQIPERAYLHFVYGYFEVSLADSLEVGLHLVDLVQHAVDHVAIVLEQLRTAALVDPGLKHRQSSMLVNPCQQMSHSIESVDVRNVCCHTVCYDPEVAPLIQTEAERRRREAGVQQSIENGLGSRKYVCMYGFRKYLAI